MKDLLGEFVMECASDSVNARKTGEMLKREGIAKVSVKGAGFLEDARNWAEYVSVVRGKVTIDDIREWAGSEGIKPHHPNCYGAVFSGKDWECIGRTKSRIPSNRSREIKIWRLRK